MPTLAGFVCDFIVCISLPVRGRAVKILLISTVTISLHPRPQVATLPILWLVQATPQPVCIKVYTTQTTSHEMSCPEAPVMRIVAVTAKSGKSKLSELWSGQPEEAQPWGLANAVLCLEPVTGSVTVFWVTGLCSACANLAVFLRCLVCFSRQ